MTFTVAEKSVPMIVGKLSISKMLSASGEDFQSTLP